MSTKLCSKCKIEKDIENFGKSSRSKSGLTTYCEECCKIRNNKTREWRKKRLQENPSYYTEQYYKNHNENLLKAKKTYYKYRDDYILKMKTWRITNPEKIKNSCQNWRKNNPYKLYEGHRRWTQEHKEHVRMYNAHRRALKRFVTIVNFTNGQLDQRMSMFGYKCAYCRIGSFDHIDHVIPLSRGGYHCLANLRPACQFCNLSKHNKKLNEWKPKG